MKKLKVKWSMNEYENLEKIPVDAGNLVEVIDSYFMLWNPPIETQIERLSQEWSDPNSDGTGSLTFVPTEICMMDKMSKELEEDIDNEIINLIGEMTNNV